jgi:hypothetical protein
VSERWLLIAPLVATTALAACGSSSAHEDRHPADLRTLTASRDFAGEKSLSANVQFAAGRLDISPAPAGNLYHAVVNYDQNQIEPYVDYADGGLHVGLRGEHNNVRLHGKARNHLDLRLGPDVPLNLDLQFGAGEARMELGGLKVESAKLATGAAKGVISFARPNQGKCDNLELQVGAARMDVTGLGNLAPQSLDLQGGVGDVNLDFSGAWANDVDARVHMGLGQLKIEVPRDVGLRVRKSSMLASFEAPDMVRQGDLWLSQGYQSARHHLDIDIDAAFGAIRVNWIAAGAAPRPASGDSSSF